MSQNVIIFTLIVWHLPPLPPCLRQFACTEKLRIYSESCLSHFLIKQHTLLSCYNDIFLNTFIYHLVHRGSKVLHFQYSKLSIYSSPPPFKFKVSWTSKPQNGFVRLISSGTYNIGYLSQHINLYIIHRIKMHFKVLNAHCTPSLLSL